MYFVTDSDYVARSEGVFTLGSRVGLRIPLGERFALFGFGETLFAPVRIGFIPLGPSGAPDPNVLWLPSVVQGYGAAGLEFIFE